MSNEIVAFRDFNADTPIPIVTGDTRLDLSVTFARKWLCPQAPEHEVLRLLLYCRNEGLDPFRKEAELVCYGGVWQIVVGKAGQLAKAQKHPAYNGFQAGIIVRPWDAKTKQFTGPAREIEGAFLPPDHLLVGGWCKVWRKDRTVQVYAAIAASEYLKDQSTHKAMPCTMLRKTAIVQAFREAGLSHLGAYDVSELGSGSAREPIYPPAAIPAAIEREYDTLEPDAGICPPDMLKRMLDILKALGVDRNGYQWRKALADRGVARECDLSEMQAREILSKLETLEPHPELEPEAAQRWEAAASLSTNPAPVEVTPEAAPVVVTVEN